MSENEIEVACQNRNCRSINIYKNLKTGNDIEYFACPACDQITIARIEKGKGSGICNYTGSLSRTPLGVINADGGKTLVDANGRSYTREKFKEVNGMDPMASLFERAEKRRVCDYIEDWIKKHAI